MASTSCGYVIRKTGAFISKKFPPHIYCIYLCFLIIFFLLSHEADGKLSGGRGGGISLVMMECTVAFCTFPPSTSHLRWLKRPNDEYLGVNPPPLLLSVFSTADVFPLTHTKGFCFCYQACPFLKGQRSRWSQGEAVTASLNIWRPSERDENSIPAKKKRLHRRLTTAFK